jgi:hypothetical protein
MKSFSPQRRELLAGFVDAFQSDFLNKAIVDGDLERAILFAREIVQRDAVTPVEVVEPETAADTDTPVEETECDTAAEFLKQFDRKEGFDEFMAGKTRNPERMLLGDIVYSTDWTDEAIMMACRA